MFFDTPYSELPKRAQYYFNILIISIAVQPEVLTDILGHKNTVDLWDVQNASYNLDRDSDYEICCIPHQVLEITPNNKISFYDMIDYDTDDPWGLEPDAID